MLRRRRTLSPSRSSRRGRACTWPGGRRGRMRAPRPRDGDGCGRQRTADGRTGRGTALLRRGLGPVGGAISGLSRPRTIRRGSWRPGAAGRQSHRPPAVRSLRLAAHRDGGRRGTTYLLPFKARPGRGTRTGRAAGGSELGAEVRVHGRVDLLAGLGGGDVGEPGGDGEPFQCEGGELGLVLGRLDRGALVEAAADGLIFLARLDDARVDPVQRVNV